MEVVCFELSPVPAIDLAPSCFSFLLSERWTSRWPNKLFVLIYLMFETFDERITISEGTEKTKNDVGEIYIFIFIVVDVVSRSSIL